MDRNTVDWEGSFPALVTPFTRDGALDERAFRNIIDRVIEFKADGVVVAGCTGEWWTLSDEERVQLFRIAVDQVHKRVPVIAGTAAIATSRVIALTKAAKEVGCDGAMMTAPPYALPKEREIIHFFQSISEAVKFPIALYNNPNRVRRSLMPELVDKLADIDTVVAIKDSSGDIDLQERTLAVCKGRIRYFKGGPKYGWRIVPQGCLGFIGTGAQLGGSAESEYYWAAKAGDVARAQKLLPDARLDALYRLEWEETGTFPASLKAAMTLTGLPAGYPREPLLPLTDEELDTLRTLLSELGFQVVASSRR